MVNKVYTTCNGEQLSYCRSQKTLKLDRSTAYIYANDIRTLTKIRCSKPIKDREYDKLKYFQ